MIKKLAKKLRKDECSGEVEVRKRHNIREAVERSADAVTFAEAGLAEEAREILAERDAHARKILVVGHEESFSRPVIEYALGFAERMGYEIVALNVLELPKDSKKMGPYCSLIAKEFENSCEESVAEFYRDAEERGIPFHHIVKFGDLDDCVKEVTQEVKRIEFVISEPEALPEVVSEDEEVVIPVYAVASPA